MNTQNGMDPQDQRNFIIAMVLMVAFVFLYQTVVINPEQEKRRAAEAAAAEQALVEAELPVAETTATIAEAETVDEALSQSERLSFDMARVDGSFNLSGPLLDDLNLKDHFRTIEKEEELRLLRPTTRKDGETSGYSADWSWSVLSDGNSYTPVMPTGSSWSTGSDSLKPGETATLTFERGGLSIQREVSVDENYLFSFKDTLTNTRSQPLTLTPIGTIRRNGAWKDFLETTEPRSSRRMGIVHQGLIASFGTDLTWRSYNNIFKGKYIKKADDNGYRATEDGNDGGWVGLTDMYWMTALVPEQDRSFRARMDRNEDTLSLILDGEDLILPANQSVTVTNQIFAGAKEYSVVRDYEEAGIPRFEDSIDWGNILYYITKPVFSALNWLKSQIGSFGLAILALTVLIRIPLLPLYNQSYKSMAKMKKLAEPMKEISERFKGDPQRRQQEIMKLYKTEKANPVAGCVPILFTIPVFFALYKTLYVTIEMRHTPFLFMRDLSAPDPTAIGNLFGLLPWAASDIKALPIIGLVIGIGILPILYGVTMAAIQALSPPPPDPTQRTIMMALPLVFMFVFGGFAAGLVLYWVWSNILSLLQQYFIMRRNGVETQLDKLVMRLLGKRSAPADSD